MKNDERKKPEFNRDNYQKVELRRKEEENERFCDKCSEPESWCECTDPDYLTAKDME